MHKVPWDMFAMYQVDDTSNFNADMKHILSSVLPFQSEIRKTLQSFIRYIHTQNVYSQLDIS